MSIETKQPSEITLFDFNFTRILSPGEVIQEMISIESFPSGLTFPGVPALSGQIAQHKVAGGVHKTLYKITMKVITNFSPVREGDFDLYVYEE